jgi:CTP synthase (UTP-ammonia lyase)
MAMSRERILQIGIVGDFQPRFAGHRATGESLHCAAESLGVGIECRWVPTPDVSEARAQEALGGFDGIWLAAGSPYASMGGGLAAARYARERLIPFFAT